MQNFRYFSRMVGLRFDLYIIWVFLAPLYEALITSQSIVALFRFLGSSIRGRIVSTSSSLFSTLLNICIYLNTCFNITYLFILYQKRMRDHNVSFFPFLGGVRLICLIKEKVL